MKTIPGILMLTALGVLSTAQTVFEGPETGPGRVVQLDDPHPRALLNEIRLLPLEVSGRTGLDALDPSRPQLRTDIPGANRILLPDGGGSLYRYQTAQEHGQVFGFLVVDPAGVGRVAFEFSGHGPQGLLDPLKGFCAIEGSTLWVTSVPEVGGDLFEIDLLAGTAVNRTTTLDPLFFLEQGLGLYPGYGIAMTTTGPLRLDRQGGVAQVLQFEGFRPSWFSPDIVSSADGSTFAFVAGASETQTHVFYGREGGLIQRASDTPTGLSGAGFAYGTNKGPWLALSTDGSVCAWISQGDSRELFVRELGHSGMASEFQVTHDQRFTDTLNDSGVIAFFSTESLVCLIGDESGNRARPIESGDLYRVDVPSGSSSSGAEISIVNLSGTSGDMALPFLSYGTLSSAGGIHRVPGLEGLLITDDEAGSLLFVDWSGQITHLVGGIETINSLHRVGQEILIEAQMAANVEENEYPSLFLLTPQSGAVSHIAELPPGGVFSGSVSHEGGSFSSIASLGPDSEFLGQFRLATGNTDLALPWALSYGPTLTYTPSGNLQFTVEFPGSTYLVEWTPSGLRVLGQYPRGFLLPGL